MLLIVGVIAPLIHFYHWFWLIKLIKMFFTPKRIKTKRSITEGASTVPTIPNLSRRLTTESEGNRSVIYETGSNKSLEEGTPITKLTISIKKSKAESPSPTKRSPVTRMNPAKFRASNCIYDLRYPIQNVNSNPRKYLGLRHKHLQRI